MAYTDLNSFPQNNGLTQIYTALCKLALVQS